MASNIVQHQYTKNRNFTNNWQFQFNWQLKIPEMHVSRVSNKKSVRKKLQYKNWINLNLNSETYVSVCMWSSHLPTGDVEAKV